MTASTEVSAPAGRPTDRYIPALDGMRALGIGLVFVHHMITPIQFGGQYGVDVFFALSGYLITDILLREREKHGRIRLKRFYLRRAARLYPALLLAAAVLLIPGAIFAPSLGRYLLENVLAVTYTTPLALQVSDGAAWAWRHTWSLGIEEMFYLVWPLIILLVLRKGRTRTCLAWVALSAGATLLIVNLFSDMIGGQVSLLLRAGGLFFGCALAVFFHVYRSLQIPAALGWAGLGMIAIAAVLGTLSHESGPAVILTVLGSVLMIGQIVRSQDGSLSRVFRWSPLAYIGRISYELYLWHYPVLIICAWAFAADPIAVAWLAAPLSIAAAAASHALLTPLVERLKRGAARFE